MFVKGNMFAAHPLFTAYFQSDTLGKAIFLALFALSIVTWTVIIYKLILTKTANKQSQQFKMVFSRQRGQPLAVEWEHGSPSAVQNPFYSIYTVMRKQTRELLHKNQRFAKKMGVAKDPTLTSDDIAYVEGYLMNAVRWQTKRLERYLFLLATVVTLAPFLGLLGTVWGIFCTFTQMQGGLDHGNQAVLAGLSLALATTVFGLIDAIPALVGYNYFKNVVRNFSQEMERFSHEALAAVEIQYRKVDL